ncbi:MAG: UDP-N-acetylenolpyruvoylglucosamine reductase [Clostridiales bacterium GWF2_38_85]|nr:MAG: UDP-N-acetylenolpyruvoylglucosamine reductase [Clostridiales bacterium GWF2_38_85]HBL84773.1 UDP-N-acetylenolpyruvoylglucosamine reductase [Clostridiales bacterium]
MKMKIYQDEPLLKHCSFKIGGNAEYVYYPETADELIGLIKKFNSEKQEYYVFGNASNVLFPDESLRKSVVFTTEMKDIRLVGNTIIAEAGVTLNTLSAFARDNVLTGLEFAYGIPGTVGGGVYMNAGAYGGQLSDIVINCRAIDSEGEICNLNATELRFGYRHSVLQEKKLILIDSTLNLKSGDKTTIIEQMDTYMSKRKGCQPLNFPSAGSVFKRPQNNYTGALIEKAGLKGMTVGGAMVSEKHAGFIINTGDATAKDVRELIDIIKARVFEQSGVMLECEVCIIENNKNRKL